MANRHEALEDLVMEDMIYVAVGVNVKECKSIIVWAVQNSGGKRICILHVHQPPKLIPFSKSQDLFFFFFFLLRYRVKYKSFSHNFKLSK